MLLNVVDRAGVVGVVKCAPGHSLMSTLKLHGHKLQAICGGAASCATCHVFIAADWRDRAGPRGEFEQMLLEDTEHYCPESSRLSCQIMLTEALDGLSLTIAPED